MSEQPHQPVIHHYILSDSIGETGIKVATSVMSQFPHSQSIVHRHNFISSEAEIEKILTHAAERESYVYMTLANEELAQIAEKYLHEFEINYINLIQPITESIEKALGVKASQQVGAQHVLNEDYFNRVNAIEFSIAADDGKDPSLFYKADILLLGISRTGKTPLSMYLGTMGYKTANLPLIPENDVPDIIFDINPNKIIGLTNDVGILNRHRRSRMREYGMPETSRYCSESRINNELEFSDAIFEEIGCHVINVSDRSIEESASIILHTLGLDTRLP